MTISDHKQTEKLEGNIVKDIQTAFQKSKLNCRSTTGEIGPKYTTEEVKLQEQTKEEEMEQVLTELKALRMDMNKEFENNNEEIRKLKEDMREKYEE